MHAGPFSDKKSSARVVIGADSPRSGTLFIPLQALHKKVRMIGIMNISTRDGRAELGTIWYSPLVQGSKVNSEVTYLFLRYLFDELGYRRIEWKCDNQNESSKRAALRMGFIYEGLFRQHMIVKGKNRDTAWFAMLDSEWRQRKINFERFLVGENVSLTRLNSYLSTEAI